MHLALLTRLPAIQLHFQGFDSFLVHVKSKVVEEFRANNYDSPGVSRFVCPLFQHRKLKQ